MENGGELKENMMANSSGAQQETSVKSETMYSEKKKRRSSTVCAELLAALYKDEPMDKITFSTQPRRRRKTANKPYSRGNSKTKARILRYSFDIGNRPLLRPCIRKTKPSLAQAVAGKLKEKYRRSRSISRTPRLNRARNCRFNSICTIHVITPRPEYDPNNLCFPSDDESGNPCRARLSTIALDITPTSKAYLDSIKDTEVEKCEFRAKMIFGDGEEDVDSEPKTCTEKSNSPVSDSRRRKRRKSVIIGAASPLKTPPMIEEDVLQLIKPKRCKKLLEFDKTQVITSSVSDTQISRMLRSGNQKESMKAEEKTEINTNCSKAVRRSSFFVGLSEESAEEIDLDDRNKLNGTKGSNKKKKERRCENIDSVSTAKEPPNDKTVSHVNRRRSQRFAVDVVKNNSKDVNLDKPTTSSKSCDSVSSTGNVSTEPTKMFSLFSPRPQRKTDTTKVPAFILPKKLGIATDDVIEINDTDNVSNTSVARVASSKREDRLKGDRIASVYTYFRNMLIDGPFIDKDDIQEGNNWVLITPRVVTKNDAPKYEFRMASLCEIEPKEMSSVEYNSCKRMCNLEKPLAIDWKPSKLKELLVGEDDLQRAQTWLRKWKKKVRKEAKKQKNSEKKGITGAKKKCSDSSDEDYEEEDETELENPLILIGPTGVGKTAFITTLAAEENMKIIGMGPEEERRGTTIKSQLTEAMRSHRVVNESSASIQTFFQKKTIIYEKSNQTPARRKSVLDDGFTQSLIVFEHVDLLFGAHDRNAASALIELVNTAMVPVVWTCDKVWPRQSSQTVLEKPPLEIHLRNRIKVVREYCKKIIHSCNNVLLDDSIMKQLSNSTDHDLRATIQQAHFYSLLPNRSLPSISRIGVSNGFCFDWNVEKKPIVVLKDEMCDRKWNEVENYVSKYEDVIRDVPDGNIRLDFPGINYIMGAEEWKLNNAKTNNYESVLLAHAALNGVHSRKDAILDFIPYLDIMDRVEQSKRIKNRRHQHRFTETATSSFPIDDEKLIVALARLRFST